MQARQALVNTVKRRRNRNLCSSLTGSSAITSSSTASSRALHCQNEEQCFIDHENTSASAIIIRHNAQHARFYTSTSRYNPKRISNIFQHRHRYPYNKNHSSSHKRWLQTSCTLQTPPSPSEPVTSPPTSTMEQTQKELLRDNKNNTSAGTAALDTNLAIERLVEEYANNLESFQNSTQQVQTQQTQMMDALHTLQTSKSADVNSETEMGGIEIPQFNNTFQNDSILNTQQTAGTQPLPHIRPNMADLLQQFDPQNPPPQDAPLTQVQLWLECQSQQETVQKYESILSAARDRRDFAAISIVQSQILQWYQPIRNTIQKEQEVYMSGVGRKGKRDIMKYGPYLCTLQPEKLAVIVCHEGMMSVLQKGATVSNGSGGNDGKNNSNGSNSSNNNKGVTLLYMAERIGSAVEAEVNVQRLLKARLEKRAEEMRSKKDNESSNNETDDKISGDNAKETTSSSSITPPKDEDYLESNWTIEPNNNKNSNDPNTTWSYRPSHLQRFMDELNSADPTRKSKVRISRANRRAMKLLESPQEWTISEKLKLGVALIQILLDHAKVDLKGNLTPFGEQVSDYGEPAFQYEKIWVNDYKLSGHITLHEEFYRLAVQDKFHSLAAHTTRQKPMVTPPVEWTGPDDGGYLALKSNLMRTHGCQMQKDALKEADLSTLLDGLNVLGRVPWKINKQILDLAQQCWDKGIALGDIPSQEDFPETDAPIRPEMTPELLEDRESPLYKERVEEYRVFTTAMAKHRRIHRKNMDLHGLRCSALLKLNQAEQFKNFESIYFPYNVDFRGRAYPIPPHLSNVGSDLCRGLLTFRDSKPLGPRGLYWLKVHLANLCGADKMSFDGRAEFTEKNMENVRASVEDPLGDNNDDGSNSNRWWMGADDPFQALATCYEIVAAIDSGDPENYECSLPVHMDGSCNGLQHYAALGRDRVGGKAVNLCNYDEPQDVYIGVMEEVIRRVAKEAERDVSFDLSEDTNKISRAQKKELKFNRAAKLVDGLVDRGVVKRTVMTSVYGVTYIGARQQIQEKIEEKLEAKGYDIDEIEEEIHGAGQYLASITMEVIAELFTGAKQTMNWLATCARLIGQQGQPVSWMSATGIPAVQPYRQSQPYTIVTLLQTIVLIDSSDDLPVNKNRQVSAFPPNYVHSLDSSHMLFTGLEMDRRGLTFSAVHDSFWTHACDIDEMNGVLRECFVDLYSQPLLEDLKKTWELQYPSIEFPDLPQRGELDLTEVKDAKYFFQ